MGKEFLNGVSFRRKTLGRFLIADISPRKGAALVNFRRKGRGTAWDA
jgi:hypothetical protein